jgi:hypothetical protein
VSYSSPFTPWQVLTTTPPSQADGRTSMNGIKYLFFSIRSYNAKSVIARWPQKQNPISF